MISDAALLTVHQAARTDCLWAIVRRNNSQAWLVDADTVDAAEETGRLLWGEKPVAIYPVMGVLPIPKEETR